MKTALRLFGLFIALFWLFSVMIDAFKGVEQPSEGHFCEDYSVVDPLTLDKTHQRSWSMPNGYDLFCTNYGSREEISRQSGVVRNLINPMDDDYASYWGTVYRSLVEQNQEWVSFVADSLLKVASESELDQSSLAELTVGFVQDIPYSFIESGTCEDADLKTHPCVSGAQFGILSPYEFLHTLSGDCDTRAVLLYSLLGKMGFDPMVVISYEYRHAMLALSIPSAGDYITWGQKNYYFWETTAVNWPIGILPPDMKNLDYWQIALVNEL